LYPPLTRPTRPPLFPYTTLFRSWQISTASSGSPAESAAIRLAKRFAASPLYDGNAHCTNRPNASWSNFPSEIVAPGISRPIRARSEEHTSELQSLRHLVCRLLLE